MLDLFAFLVKDMVTFQRVVNHLEAPFICLVSKGEFRKTKDALICSRRSNFAASKIDFTISAASVYFDRIELT